MAEDWNDTFYDLFREAVGRYHEGHRNVDGFFTDQEIIFLSSIGCRTRELFDFVELYARTGEPSPTTVLLMAAARRDFFLTIQHGQFYQGKPVIGYDLPGFGDELSGLPYLPRLIAKRGPSWPAPWGMTSSTAVRTTAASSGNTATSIPLTSCEWSGPRETVTPRCTITCASAR